MQPHVTSVIGKYQDFGRVPKDVLDFAAARGTCVHDIIRDELKGEWVPIREPAARLAAQGYYDSWKTWFETLVAAVHAVEVRLECDCDGYQGQLDAVIQIKGDDCLTIVDWKTPVTANRLWRAQVAAYWHLATHHWQNPTNLPVKRAGTLQLRGDGKPAKFHEYTQYLEADYNAYQTALRLERYFAA